MAASLAERTGLPVGRGGRLVVEHDLTVDEVPGVYAVGDVANVPAPDGTPYPQLGSVALQSGQWAARNVVADIRGRSRKPFHYHDKGIMAMIGRGAAVAEIGEHRHELHGAVAFASWLGVHAYLMSGVRSRADAFVSWGWDYFSTNRTPAIVDRSDAGRIDWGDEADEADEAARAADAADPAGTDEGTQTSADRAPADDDHRRQPDAIRAP
jgi:NADH dehydrogenase